ncbi:hypothetical protein ACU686_09610 [Yinghuangia aomiensis]
MSLWSAEESVAAADSVAVVVRDGAGWRGLSAADGSPLWYTEAGRDCTPTHVSAGRGAVVAVTRCPDGTQALVLDPHDGRTRSRTPLPVAGGAVEFAVLSLDPVVLWVDEEAERGTRAALVLNTDGTIRTTIASARPDRDLLIGSFDTHHGRLFTARPVPAAVVVGDLLVVTPVKPGDRHASSNNRGVSVRYDGRVAAYSLTDGSLRWTSDVKEESTASPRATGRCGPSPTANSSASTPPTAHTPRSWRPTTPTTANLSTSRYTETATSSSPRTEPAPCHPYA